MSNIRRSHPGYFRVTLGLSVAWYLALAIGFGLSGPAEAKSPTYRIVSAYVPLHAWAAVYGLLGLGLLASILVRRIPHLVVHVCCAAGLCLTLFWLCAFAAETIAGRIHAIMIIPALLLIAMVEWAALVERESGPGPSSRRISRAFE